MSESTARGLRGAGALLTAFSLLLPWYVLKAQSLTGLGMSGFEALGALSLLLIGLAIVAGSTFAARMHPLLPAAAAFGLVLLVIVQIASPPGAAQAIAGQDNSPLVTAASTAIADSFGLGYSSAWGIWVAAAGAAMAAIGSIAGARTALGARYGDAGAGS